MFYLKITNEKNGLFKLVSVFHYTLMELEKITKSYEKAGYLVDMIKLRERKKWKKVS